MMLGKKILTKYFYYHFISMQTLANLRYLQDRLFFSSPFLSQKTISSQANGKASAQQQRNNSNAGRNAKRKTNKRAAKRKKYVEKLIQKSV